MIYSLTKNNFGLLFYQTVELPGKVDFVLDINMVPFPILRIHKVKVQLIK